MSHLKLFLAKSLTQAASASAWCSVAALIAAVMMVPACVNEQDSGAEPNKASNAPGAASNPKLAAYSQAPGAQKIDLNLLRLAQKVRSEDLSLRQGARHAGFVAVGKGMVLDIVTNDIQTDDQHKFRLPGVDIRHFSPKYNRVSVMIRDLDRLHELAALPEVRSIAPEYGATTRGGSQR